VAEGQLLRGARGVAGHIGHLTIEADGAPCFCGNRGCLETVFSARAIEAEAMRAIHLGCETALRGGWDNTRGDTSAGPDCRAVFEAAAQGDEVARLIRDQAVHKLAAAVAGLLHVFDPEVVIVGGEISAAGEALFAPLRQGIAWRTARLIGRTVPLVPPQVVDRSGIIGAAALLQQAGLTPDKKA
jgi:glucokinase